LSRSLKLRLQAAQKDLEGVRTKWGVGILENWNIGF
jgi:hypothetical protein